jgi:SRSO17 transposase
MRAAMRELNLRHRTDLPMDEIARQINPLLRGWIEYYGRYVSRHGHAFIDRALYLPKEWTDDPDRLEAAYVPPGVGFATKPKLATKRA